MRHKTVKICQHFLLIPFLFLFSFNISAKTVQGIAIDVKSDEPLSNVVVMIIDTSDVILSMQTTDSTGVFSITGIKQTEIKVRTYRYGYVSTTTGPYNLTTHDTLKMIIRLEAIPFSLPAVEVSAKRVDPYLRNVHFYDREKTIPGQFITYKDFKYRGLTNAYDIFKGIPGLIVKYGQYGANGIYFARYSSSSLNASQPEPLIYVDGLYISQAEKGETMGWLSPEDILAVEVYNTINAPEEYSQGLHKGVILIWTKH